MYGFLFCRKTLNILYHDNNVKETMKMNNWNIQFNNLLVTISYIRMVIIFEDLSALFTNHSFCSGRKGIYELSADIFVFTNLPSCSCYRSSRVFDGFSFFFNAILCFKIAQTFSIDQKSAIFRACFSWLSRLLKDSWKASKVLRQRCIWTWGNIFKTPW